MRLSSSAAVVGVVLAVVAFNGCSSSAVDPVAGDVFQQTGGSAIRAAVGDTFALRVGETAQIRGPDIRVTFVDVSEDSRCPTGVQCVWAGNARVGVQLSQGGASTDASLNTTLDPRTVSYEDHTLVLVELRPQPRVGEPVPQAEYVARLMLVRAN